MSKCKTCNGDGYTAEHLRDTSCNRDEHAGCPIQAECENCKATGETK